MPTMRGSLHFLRARLEDRVELGAILANFPGPRKTGGHHEGLAGTELPALSRLVGQNHPAPGQAAELRLGVADAPGAGGARPDAAVKLPGRIAEVVRDGLPRRARDDPLGRG